MIHRQLSQASFASCRMMTATVLQEEIKFEGSVAHYFAPRKATEELLFLKGRGKAASYVPRKLPTVAPGVALVRELAAAAVADPNEVRTATPSPRREDGVGAPPEGAGLRRLVTLREDEEPNILD